jgi:hypothetical protein
MVHSRVKIEPITYFYLSLLFWDVIAALGMAISVRWVVLYRLALLYQSMHDNSPAFY